MKWNRWVLALVLAGLWPGLAAAAELDGSQLSALWGCLLPAACCRLR
jgi:hypothetical protein